MVDHKPRICYVSEAFYPVTGGIESQGRAFVEYFTSQKFEVLVITGHVPKSVKREQQLFGARVLRIPPSSSLPGKQRWSMIVTSFIWLVKERKHFDIIFVDGFRSLGVSAVLIGHLFKKKVVLKPENFGEMSGEFFDGRLRKYGLSSLHWLVRPFLYVHNLILKSGHRFVPNTTDTQREILSCGVREGQVHLIPNVYNASKFFPASVDEKRILRNRLGIDEQRTVAVFIGRLVAWKGPQHLVSMWRNITKTYVQPLLILVGPDGNDMFDCAEEIRDYIKQHKMQNNVMMTGGVENVEDYLKVSDFFVFPSQGGETATTALMEAMDCGLPIITTDATGVVDLVTRETGIVVGSRDFQEFEEAIVKMIVDESLRKRLGSAGQKRANQLYTPDCVYPQYLHIFRSLMGNLKH